MPVHHHADDWLLAQLGLKNYWGYNTLSYFAPDVNYASSNSPMDAVREFKMMVRALHAANLEVILDVGLNHTAGRKPPGPAPALRGIRQPVYFRLLPTNSRFYQD